MAAVDVHEQEPLLDPHDPWLTLPNVVCRTAARAYRRVGVSGGVVMKILGHKTRSILERCNIKDEADLRDAAQAISAQGQLESKVGREQGRRGTNPAEVVRIASAPSKS
jgi:hypothetical protein